MSIRAKVLLFIATIVITVILITMRISLYFVRSSLEQTVEGTIYLMRDIAEELVSKEINLLKNMAATTALLLTDAPENRWPQILAEQVDSDPLILGLTVFDRKGVVLSSGALPTPADLADSRYMRRAFAGEAAISTTRKDPGGALVFHVCAPMGEYALSMTIPGLHFRDLLAPYRLWTTGRIFMLDEEGTVLANEIPSLVADRFNSIQEAKTNPAERSAADFARLMLRGGKGKGRHSIFGVERLAVYTDISGSGSGWALAVSAPLSESPAARVDDLLLITALVLLGLGLAAALFISRIIAAPFQTVEEQNRHLAELNETARAASEAKTRFLANMSHEMRTPLNAIIGFSELMLNAPAEREEGRENLEKIYTAGMILLSTVNDVLDISKIESGRFEIVPVEYHIASLINDTVTMNIMRAGEKPIEFGMKIDENLPGRMIGDELRIKQICNNLLSNAFKYTQEGHVDLSVSGERDGDSVWLTISVKDTGPGIPAGDMEKLFSGYSRPDSGDGSKIEGSGLGLAITRRVAEMMDGCITVESECGKGSTFTARVRQRIAADLPMGAPAAGNLKNYHSLGHGRARQTKRVIQPLPQARVLVVDDVMTNLDVARGILKPYGMRVDCASGGQQAIDLVREEKVRYHTIFMDHMMPGLDGIEATRRIRQEIGTEYAKTVPIIALTANAIAGNERMFMESGFQAFLSKPIDIPRLDLVMDQWVRDRVREEIESEAEEEPKEAPAADLSGPRLPERGRIDGLDLEQCLERFGGDTEVVFQTLRSYAANTPGLLDQLRNPAEGNLADYTIVVHGLKSSSYGICAQQLGKLAEDLERAALAGDLAFIREHNQALLRAAEELIAALSALLSAAEAEEGKPKREEPDGAALDRLRQACAGYDMDGVDAAMAELEGYAYRRRQDLVVWLRERVEAMDFQQIIDKLTT